MCGAFTVGHRFAAELVFYPARVPLRAVVVARSEAGEIADGPWPDASYADPLAGYVEALLAAPWRLEAPILLPQGRICQDSAGRAWWACESASLPLDASPPTLALGVDLNIAAGIWNGARLGILSGRSPWGRLAFDA